MNRKISRSRISPRLSVWGKEREKERGKEEGEWERGKERGRGGERRKEREERREGVVTDFSVVDI